MVGLDLDPCLTNGVSRGVGELEPAPRMAPRPALVRCTDACVRVAIFAALAPCARAQADCEESGAGWVWPVILVIVLAGVAIGVGMKRKHSKQISAIRRQQLQELAEAKATEAIEVATREIEEDMESAHISMAELGRTASKEIQTKDAVLLAKDEEIARLKERLAAFEGVPSA